MTTASSTMVFENPADGRTETVSGRSGLWAFLGGPAYFAAKGEWMHAAIHGALTILGLLMWPTGILMAVGVWFGYACAATTILEARFKRLGWRKLSIQSNH